jgi:hypothetical protein
MKSNKVSQNKTKSNNISPNEIKSVSKNMGVATKPNSYEGKEIPASDMTQVSELATPQSLVVSENTFFQDLTQSPPTQSWSTDERKRHMEYDRMKAMVKGYVKTELFHVLKFVSSPSLIQFSSAPKSLCQVVCKKFNVSPHNQESFWNNYGNLIEKTLNRKRSDVSNLMKKAFKGMHEHSLCFSGIIILINCILFP